MRASVAEQRYGERSNSAHVAELVDAHGSGPCAARCGGSSPSVGTTEFRKNASFGRRFAFPGPFARRPPAQARNLAFALDGMASSPYYACLCCRTAQQRQRRQSPRGGIGRRAWFRSMCRKVWGFESLRGHHSSVFDVEQYQQYHCPRGGIGRRAWFRSMCRKVWGFESLRGHQEFRRKGLLREAFSHSVSHIVTPHLLTPAPITA
jgi:hypothetical protein